MKVWVVLRGDFDEHSPAVIHGVYATVEAAAAEEYLLQRRDYGWSRIHEQEVQP